MSRRVCGSSPSSSPASGNGRYLRMWRESQEEVVDLKRELERQQGLNEALERDFQQKHGALAEEEAYAETLLEEMQKGERATERIMARAKENEDSLKRSVEDAKVDRAEAVREVTLLEKEIRKEKDLRMEEMFRVKMLGQQAARDMVEVRELRGGAAVVQDEARVVASENRVLKGALRSSQRISASSDMELEEATNRIARLELEVINLKREVLRLTDEGHQWRERHAGVCRDLNAAQSLLAGRRGGTGASAKSAAVQRGPLQRQQHHAERVQRRRQRQRQGDDGSSAMASASSLSTHRSSASSLSSTFKTGKRGGKKPHDVRKSINDYNRSTSTLERSRVGNPQLWLPPPPKSPPDSLAGRDFGRQHQRERLNRFNFPDEEEEVAPVAAARLHETRSAGGGLPLSSLQVALGF